MYEDMLNTDEDRFIYSCCLYEMAERPVMSDADFNALCRRMLDRYGMLCPLFRARVARHNLEFGSSLGLTFSEKEKREASAWRHEMEALSFGGAALQVHEALDRIQRLRFS